MHILTRVVSALVFLAINTPSLALQQSTQNYENRPRPILSLPYNFFTHLAETYVQQEPNKKKLKDPLPALHDKKTESKRRQKNFNKAVRAGINSLTDGIEESLGGGIQFRFSSGAPRFEKSFSINKHSIQLSFSPKLSLGVLNFDVPPIAMHIAHSWQFRVNVLERAVATFDQSLQLSSDNSRANGNYHLNLMLPLNDSLRIGIGGRVGFPVYGQSESLSGYAGFQIRYRFQ